MRAVGAELSHMDGWTDMTKLTVVFRSFANAPNKVVVAPARTGNSFYCGPTREAVTTCPVSQPSFCNCY